MVLVVPDCFDTLAALEAAGEFMPPVVDGDRLSFLAAGIDVFWEHLPWTETAKDEHGFVNNVCYVFNGVKASRRRIHIFDNRKKEFTGEVREVVDVIPCPSTGATKLFVAAAYSVTPCGQLEWHIEAESFDLHIPAQNILPGALLPPGARWINGSLLGAGGA
jgi:hypothetical protein